MSLRDGFHWLTLQDAAMLIGEGLKESVSVADVLRLALDRRLALSVLFARKALGRLGKVVPYAEAEWHSMDLPIRDPSKAFPGKSASLTVHEWPSEDGRTRHIKVLHGSPLPPDGSRVFVKDEQDCYVDGIWNLPMTGPERLSVEDEYYAAIGKPPSGLVNLDPLLVVNDRDEWFEVRDSDEGFTFPAIQLPAGSILVVLKSSVADYLTSAAAAPSPVPNRPAGGRWWETNYDIADLIATTSANLKLAGKRVTSRGVSKLVAKYIADSERRGGRDRTIGADSIRKTYLSTKPKSGA